MYPTLATAPAANRRALRRELTGAESRCQACEGVPSRYFQGASTRLCRVLRTTVDPLGPPGREFALERRFQARHARAPENTIVSFPSFRHPSIREVLPPFANKKLSASLAAGTRGVGCSRFYRLYADYLRAAASHQEYHRQRLFGRRSRPRRTRRNDPPSCAQFARPDRSTFEILTPRRETILPSVGGRRMIRPMAAANPRRAHNHH